MNVRDRIQEVLVADGAADAEALVEANRLCDDLRHSDRVQSKRGLFFERVREAIAIRGNGGDLIETIPISADGLDNPPTTY
jgi:hypothetical protein